MMNLILTVKSHLHFQVNLFCLLCALITSYLKVPLSIASTHGWWRAAAGGGGGVGGGFVLTLFSNPL